MFRLTLNLENILCTLCLRVWVFHVNSVFLANVFSEGMYSDTLFIELFYICLAISQTIEKGKL